MLILLIAKNAKHTMQKRNEIIMKATNNGKCWWVYQSIVADTHYRSQDKKRR